MRLRRILLLLLVLAVGGFTAFAINWVRVRTPDKSLPRYTGKTMPPFSLVDLHGRTWTNADLAGKTAFINVWATWCKPCREEMPHLQELYDRVKDCADVVLVTFNVDEHPEKAPPFIAEHRHTFPVLYAHDFVRNELKVVGIPRNWVLDADGVWRADKIGLPLTLRSWVSWAEGLIDKGRSASST